MIYLSLDQNLYGPRSSVRNIYEESNTNTRVGDQNLYGPGSSIRNIYKESNLRPLAMPLGRNQVIVNPSGNSLPMVSNEVNFLGEVNGQNVHGHQTPRSNLNTNCGGLAQIPIISKLLLDLEMNQI